jgi:hypothetical protein
VSEQREAQPAVTPAPPAKGEPVAATAIERLGRIDLILSLSRTAGNWAVGVALRRGSLPGRLAAGSGAVLPPPPEEDADPQPVVPPRRRRRRPARLPGRVHELGRRAGDATVMALLRRARSSRAGAARATPPAPSAQDEIRGHRYVR